MQFWRTKCVRLQTERAEKSVETILAQDPTPLPNMLGKNNVHPQHKLLAELS